MVTTGKILKRLERYIERKANENLIHLDILRAQAESRGYKFDFLQFLLGTAIGNIILGLIILALGAFLVVFLKAILLQILTGIDDNTSALKDEYNQYTNWIGIGFLIAGATIAIKGVLSMFRS